MKQIFTVFVLMALVGCKEVPKTIETETSEAKTEVEFPESVYPDALVKVFDAHGGLENWRKQRTLTFEISKPDGNEVQTVDLYSRNEKIEMPGISTGFDGTDIWLSDPKNAYKGNAAVYHNLMFYFYAMPFVLADSGINYETAEHLVYEGKSYPGIHIGYDAGIGASPKDDYYLHYDAETYQMAWLGYTFTYGSDKKSDDVRWIRYGDWMDVNGVLLPKSLTWHNYEGRTIKEGKDPLDFVQVSLSETSRPNTFYAAPENAKVVLKP